MTTVRFERGRTIVNGVAGEPSTPDLPNGDRPSMLALGRALHSHRTLVGPHELAVMRAKVRSCAKDATPTERAATRSPQYLNSLRIVLGSWDVYGRILAEIVPPGSTRREMFASMAAHQNALMAAYTGDDTTDLIRTTIADIAREWTFQALRALRDANRQPAWTYAEQCHRAYLNRTVRALAGIWHAALNP